MKSRQPAPVMNLATLPVLLLIEDMAALYRISTRTIRRLIEQNEFNPIPFEKYPFRWRREDVLRHLNGPSHKLRSRPHGFATTKAHTRRHAAARRELATK